MIAGRIAPFMALFILSAVIFYQMYTVRYRKEPIQVRRLPGVDAIEEAVGRATEMDKPVFCVPGRAKLTTVGGGESLAGVAILAHVARLTARNKASLVFAQGEPELYAVGLDTIETAYREEDALEYLRPEDMQFITQERWGFVSGLIGMMLRRGIAAGIWTGNFGAEALNIAETGASQGAIQVAGTQNLFQIPFWVAACDYVLIGEELFAAGAYLSGDDVSRSVIRGQDFGKVITLAAIVLGAILATAGLGDWLREIAGR